MHRTWVVVVVAAAVAVAAAAAESEPVRVVRRLNDALIAVLRDAGTLGYRGRFERLAPVVTAAYDVQFMAEKSLGQRWKTLSDAERQEWLGLSREFSVANYAANFDRWTGQSIELLGEEPGASDTVVVRTRIVDPKADPVELSYRLHRTDAGWKIVDVYLKGTVSELALRRADYASVLERQGFAALAGLMRSRIADLAAGRGKRQGS
jgi:phospholipid transport system substrate-binding protein